MVAFREVLDWVEGRLAPSEAARVQAAVDDDPGLADAARWVRAFRTAASQLRLEAPPAHVREQLMKRFALYRPAPPTLAERVRAVIGFDSALGAAALGVRAGTATGTRHLVLTAGDVDVALDLYPEDRSVRVEGQLLPLDAEASAAGTVELVRDGTVLAAAPSDDSGRFSLAPVPAGDVLLTVTLGTMIVEGELVLEV